MNSNDLTDTQWQVIKKLIPNTERKRKHDLRAIFDAIFYVLKTGSHWRMLPEGYPKWQLVYFYFSKWRDEELFVHMNDLVREETRMAHNKKAQCTAVIIDSQSVKTTRRGGLRGVDGNKKINGRKRHVLVDTMGNIVSNVVHPANIHDSVGAKLLFKNVGENIHGIRTVFADGGYRGKLMEHVKMRYGYQLKIVSKISKKISPKRWIVERTFAWLESFRRLSKDFEYLLESSQVMLYLASLKLMLNKF